MNENDHDAVLLLRAEIDSIKAKLEGNVPERCVRIDAALQDIRSEINSIQSTLQWIWRTLAAAAISLAASALSNKF